MVNHRAGAENRSDAGPLRDPLVGWYRGGMSLRAQALEEFDLPAAPQRVDDLPPPAPGTSVCSVHTPAGRVPLFFRARGPSPAVEAALFGPLARARHPAPAPRRARRRCVLG